MSLASIRIARSLFAYVIVALVAGPFAACGTSSPTEATPLVQVEGPGFVTPMACPVDLDVGVNDGMPTPVTFPPPTVANVGQIDKSSCDPASGSTFPLGTTEVTCSVVGAEELVSSCSFLVQVSQRILTKSKFLAFGDSITLGIVSQAPAIFPTATIPTSYPVRLESALHVRYPVQSFTVINSGKGGEQTPEGRNRIRDELDRHRPDVVMILEGVNNLLGNGTSRTASDLESMIRSGQSAGADVLIATLTPVTEGKTGNRPGLREAIRDLNSRIRGLAGRYRIEPAVDLFRAFEGRPGLIGQDGLHPTVEGHQVIADEFLEAIVDRFESRSLPGLSEQSSTSPSGLGGFGEGRSPQ